MPRFIRFLLIVALLCVFVYPAKSATAQQVVYISTEDDLYELELRPNGTFVLTEDIVLGGSHRVMFADKDNPFCGTFDGGGHTLSYFDLCGDGDVLAFIGYLGKGGVIKNLNFVNSRVMSTNKNAFVGGIIAYNGGKIIDCSFSGSVQRDGKTLGEEYFLAGFGTGTVEFSSNFPAENRCDICAFECDENCDNCTCFSSAESAVSKTVYSETVITGTSSDYTTASDGNTFSSEDSQSYFSGESRYSATDNEKVSSKTSSRKSVSSVTSVSVSESVGSSSNKTTVADVTEETAESDGNNGIIGNVVVFSCSAVLVISCAVAAVKEVKHVKKNAKDTEK